MAESQDDYGILQPCRFAPFAQKQKPRMPHRHTGYCTGTQHKEVFQRSLALNECQHKHSTPHVRGKSIAFARKGKCLVNSGFERILGA